MAGNKNEPIRVTDLSSAGTAKIDNKCAKCSRSICCNSINQKIPTPKSKEDFDHLLWQISHDNINVFKDCDGWFLHIQTNCQHLQTSGICGIYENRPWVCREYNNDYCEFDESIAHASEHFFSNADELNNYCRQRFKKWDKRFELYQ
ncbi:MAG: YkgJ family cysteine cluster protein [Pseudohongiellaceae bacterium]